MGNVKQWLNCEIGIFYVNFMVLFVFLLIAYTKDKDDVIKGLNKEIKNMIESLKNEHNCIHHGCQQDQVSGDQIIETEDVIFKTDSETQEKPVKIRIIDVENIKEL